MNYPSCTQCQSQYTYHDGVQLVCPECGYEWQEHPTVTNEDTLQVKDANGAILNDGDTIVLTKDLKVKGSSQIIKQGTKVKNIRLQKGEHNIACKIEGSPLNLKSEFVKKA